MAQSLYTDIIELIKQLQEAGTDPIGFGEWVRARQSDYWKAAEWREVYKKAQVKLNVGVNMDSYGTIR